MTDPTHLPPLKPIGPGPTYENVHIWLPQLYAETARGGASAIENRVFSGVRFEGPAVILPIRGCTFENCNMGDASGDIRNMLFIPAAPQKVTGAIPLVNCTFRNCAFFAVGFTGSADFLRQFQDMVAGARE
ncbi:MAG: hypothetical protein DCF29_06625 [Alphaproteobacteria bacterium]|nr:MAG: hypothetical protein DCF29_06625 [Alphaproteobacteria bacterium]